MLENIILTPTDGIALRASKSALHSEQGLMLRKNSGTCSGVDCSTADLVILKAFVIQAVKVSKWCEVTAWGVSSLHSCAHTHTQKLA